MTKQEKIKKLDELLQDGLLYILALRTTSSRVPMESILTLIAESVVEILED